MEAAHLPWVVAVTQSHDSVLCVGRARPGLGTAAGPYESHLDQGLFLGVVIEDARVPGRVC